MPWSSAAATVSSTSGSSPSPWTASCGVRAAVPVLGEQTVAARASAAASLAQPASPQAAPDPVAAPTLSYGLVGAFAPLEEEDQEGETRFEDSWDEDDDLSGAADPGAPCGHGWPDSPAQAPAPVPDL